MSNTNHKYVSQTERGWFVFTVPAFLSSTTRTVSRRNLSDIIAVRNIMLGYDPDLPDPVAVAKLPDKHTVIAPVLGSEIVIGAMGDTHLASQYERLDALTAYYKELEQLGVRSVFHAGNYVEGDATFNKTDTKVSGLDNQIDYVIQNHPEVPGITTYFIDGNDHEGWWWKREGVYPGRVLQQAAEAAGRFDLKYLGYMEADVVFTLDGQPVTMRVMHGGGGSARSVSLAAQNIIDSWTAEELPNMLILGHYHKAHFLPNHRGVAAIQTGTFQEQTPFMRNKNLIAALGGWSARITRSSSGRLRVGAMYHHFEPFAWKHQRRLEPLKIEGI